MKKFIIVLIYCLTALLLSACVGQKDDISLIEDSGTVQVTADETGSKLTIALVMKTLTNPFFIEMEQGARKAEKEFGINLIVKTGAQETSIDQQIAIVEELISQKVDAIVIAPGSSTELIPVLKKAQDAGIEIVNIDNQLNPELSLKLGLKDVPFISVDNIQGGYLSAKFIADLLDKPTKVAVIQGIKDAKNSTDRAEGAMKAFRENAFVTSVVTDIANWKIDEAYSVTKRLFQENPDIGAVFCANDMMALGTIQYLDDVKRTNVLVAGFDDLEEAKKALEKGRLQVTIDQQAGLQGYEGIKCALDLIDNKKVNKEQIIDVKVITKSSL